MSKSDSAPELARIPGIELQGGEPVFNEPWEAQAFAMVVRLHEAGVFTWSQWAEALSAQIHGGRQRSYYQHWLDALETLLAQGDLVSRDVLERRQLAWRAAAARTPHGEPIEL